MPTTTHITFVCPDSGNPSYTIQPHGIPTKREGSFETRPVQIRDARLLDNAPTLDINGFQLISSETTLPAEVAETDVPSAAFLEVEAAILNVTGAEKVYIYDHTIRNSAPTAFERGVASHAHVDYTGWSFENKLRSLGVSVEKKRVLQVNAWRPLREPVFASPLALADCRTVKPRDLVSCELIYPDRRGQISEVTYSPAQRWFYYPRMMRNELLLFKGYDSAKRPSNNVCPHSAFTHPDEAAETPARRSIEFRAYAIYGMKRT